MPTQIKQKSAKTNILVVIFFVFLGFIVLIGMISLFLTVDHKSNHREKVEAICRNHGYKTFNFNGNSHYVCLNEQGAVFVPEVLE